MEQLMRDQASCEMVLRVMIEVPDIVVPEGVQGVKPRELKGTKEKGKNKGEAVW